MLISTKRETLGLLIMVFGRKKRFCYVCYARIYVCTQLVCLVFSKARNSFGYLKTGLTDGFEPSCGCWESNPDALEEHPVFLIAEPFL